MPSLKGLACVSLLTLAIAAPSAFAQSTDSNPPARAPSAAPANPSVLPGDQQATPKARKHHKRGKKSSKTQGQPGTATQ